MAWNDLRSFVGSLGGVVGNGRASRPEDVAKVQHAMGGLGRYRRPNDEPNGILDRGLDRAIRGYQADRGLKQDGWMAPRGETAREIGTDLGLLRFAEDSELTPEVAESSLRSKARIFNGLGWLGETIGGGDGGFRRAGEYLDHYLGRSGTPKTLTAKEVDAEPALRNAERANLRRIEALTFTANTREKSLNDLLKNLPDRQAAVDLKDSFEIGPSFWDHMRRPGTYFALGRTGVRSELDAKAKRVGDQIAIEGWVTHRLDNRGREENKRGRFGDTIDFNPGQPGWPEASTLEPLGRAKPFDVDYTHKQSVTALIRRGPDGAFTVERAIWGDPR
jgi:hypothetical protein